MNEYAIYKGEEILGIGTISELAKMRGVLPGTIRYYTMPAYQKKVEKRKKARNYITVIKLDDE